MLENIPKDKILDVVKEGPTIPQKIVKRVGGDTMIVGAILSTLVSNGNVSVSSLKIGSSPLYYMSGQEDKLEGFIDHLNEKDQKTWKLLKDKHILQDSAQDPLIRVSLRTIKDFAKSFEMMSNGKKELFWRYYLYDKDEASEKAREILVSQVEKIVEKPAEKIVEKPERQAEKFSEKAEIERPSETIIYKTTVQAEIPLSHAELHNAMYVEPQKHVSTKKDHAYESTEKKDFYETIKDHIHKKNLDIISKEKIKKTEYTMVLKNHDKNEYIYCVAKDKKTINEGDLSTAYVFSQNKKMHCLFMMTGDLTKKAEAMIHQLKEMEIEKIE